MNKKRVLTIVIIILLIVVSFLFVFKVGRKNINKSYYAVDLDASYETSQMWSYKFSEDGIVEVRKSEYDGNTQKQHFEFIGLKKGKVDVTFEYKNIESTDTIKQEKITLVVDKKLNIKKK